MNITLSGNLQKNPHAEGGQAERGRILRARFATCGTEPERRFLQQT